MRTFQLSEAQLLEVISLNEKGVSAYPWLDVSKIVIPSEEQNVRGEIMKMEREFNIFGPIDPKIHYHVDRIAVKSELHEKVVRGRYFTLNASRQTGKTTIFHEMITELEATGEYFGILLNFEALVDYDQPTFYEELGFILSEWREYYAPTAPEPNPLRRHSDLARWLRQTSRLLDKKCVLIIDEYEAVSPEITKALLSQFRNLYIQRNQPNAYSPHSILLVGVRTIPDLLGGTQSPFNIADQFTVPYFTEDEVRTLLTQYTDATGQVFEDAVIQGVYEQSEGQPFLVNRLGQMLTTEMDIDISQPITRKHLDRALIRLVNEHNTHFFSIESKANLHRSEVVNALFSGTRYYDFRDEVTRSLLMYGVLRTVTDEQDIEYARIANPIYQKVLVKAFAPARQFVRQVINGSTYHRYIVEGSLNFDGLLDNFKGFMEEYGVRLLKSEATQRPLEISGQYLLLSYLIASLQTIGGHVTIESLSSAGELDILAMYREQRFIVEIKIWHGKVRYKEAQDQLAGYLKAAGLPKGYLVIFDEKINKNLILEEKGEIFEITVDEKVLRVYLIGISL